MNEDELNEYGWLAQKWLVRAERDYKSAYFHVHGTDSPEIYETSCFLCQQTAEKALKAVIIYLGIPGGLPRSHDIRFLLNHIHGTLKSKKNIDIHAEFISSATILSDYAVDSRYPDDTSKEDIFITRGEALKALGNAESILGWVKNIINE